MASSGKKLGIFALLGPGLLVAATGVGAGDLATASFAGNKLGMAILWAVVIGAILKFVLNEGLTRWQLATNETLLEGAIKRLGKPAAYVFLVYLILWSFFVGSALISACGVATQAMLPFRFSNAEGADITYRIYGCGCSILGVILVRLGGFKLFEKIMGVSIVIMFATVLVTAVAVKPDLSELIKGLTVPSIPNMSSGGLDWTIALIGGVGGTLTVLCYGYWIREKGRTSMADLKTCRIDLATAYAATAVFGLAMVVIGSTIDVDGKGVKLIVNLADQLETHALGKAGRWLFLIGAWCALFSSLLGVWQAVPYIFADYMRLMRTHHKRRDATGPADGDAPDDADAPADELINTSGPAYRIFLMYISIAPMWSLMSESNEGFEHIQKVYAIAGAMFMPMLAVVLLLLNGRTKWVGAQAKNKPLTVAALMLILVFFGWAGYKTIQKKLGLNTKPKVSVTQPTDIDKPHASSLYRLS